MGSTSRTTSVSLSGQVAIVTGGGRGLGRVYAQALASAGAAVAVVARSPDQVTETVSLIGAAGGRAQGFTADVTDRAAVERLVKESEEHLGPVELLVNNAALGNSVGPAWEVDPDAWWRCMDVNVRGPLLCCRAVLPAMLARRRGRIVNVASGAGTLAIPYASAYVVSKTALLRLTENLAAETGEHGVAVFAVSPGTVRTAMTEHLLTSAGGRRWLPWFGKIFEDGRDESPGQSARLLLRLASGFADGLTGRFITTLDDLDELVKHSERVRRDDLHTLRLRRLEAARLEAMPIRPGDE